MKLISSLKDNEFEYSGYDHIRLISRGVLLNDKNEVAILKVTGNDMFGYRDYYELPGGGVKPYESLEDAVKREIGEETGYQSLILKEIGYVEDYYNLIRRKNISYYYLLKENGFIGKNPEDYEKVLIEKCIFVPIDEAIELFTDNMHGKVGKLVKERELPVLKLAKSLMEEK